MRSLRSSALAAALALLGGCDTDSTDAVAALRAADAAQLQQGLAIYRANCASCHGPNGEGAPDWRRLGADGKYPAPPLDGTGHAWHHPRAMLAAVIRKGSPGGGNMPAWEGKLSEAEIQAVIDWFQSQWPEEVLRAWAEIERRARQPS